MKKNCRMVKGKIETEKDLGCNLGNTEEDAHKHLLCWGIEPNLISWKRPETYARDQISPFYKIIDLCSIIDNRNYEYNYITSQKQTPYEFKDLPRLWICHFKRIISARKTVMTLPQLPSEHHVANNTFVV